MDYRPAGRPSTNVDQRQPSNIYDLLHRLADLVPWGNEAEWREAHQAIDKARELSVFGTSAMLADVSREEGSDE